MKHDKPLGIKTYGTIPHIRGSRQTPTDRTCHEGQQRIATEKARDRHDHIIVQEKIDGSNCGVVKLEGQILALGRAGYLARTSRFEQHQLFAAWVHNQESRFAALLNEGERLVGEWLAQAHGTRYDLPHEPFVVFDIMIGHERLPYDAFFERVKACGFVIPRLIGRGGPCSVTRALSLLEPSGHGAVDPVEGAVWRVERDEQVNKQGSERRRVVDFLVKYVRPDKVDGCFLPEITGQGAVWNWRPNGGRAD